MPRAKKKTLSQKVVSVSAMGMPASVQNFLGNRIVSMLVILIAPLLFAFGLISLEWENGFPKLSVNRDRAKQVREHVVERAQELRESNTVEELVPAAENQEKKSLFGNGPLSSLRKQFDNRR